MKNKLETRTINSEFKAAREILKPDIVVLSGIKELDMLTGGFKTGELTYIEGDSKIISKIPDQVCVNTYRTFEKDSIYIDAGMCADPYKISSFARKLELDSKKVLESVHLSRAFTVHQLTTLIQDRLEDAIKRYKPKTLIIGRFPIFYLDSDVKEKEAQTLLRSNIHKIKELTVKYGLVTIFSNLDKRMQSSKRNVKNILYKNADEIILLKETDFATRVEVPKKDKTTLILHLAKGQLRLQEFGMVIGDG